MEIKLDDLLEAGMHFGHQKQRWSPKMKPYIFAVRDNTHIIDLVKTKEKLESAISYAQDLVKDGKVILFVGTKKQAQEPITELAQKTGMPYITTRWLGGMLTNFQNVKKSIEKLIKIKEDFKAGAFDNYTKKERKKFDDEVKKMESSFGGLINLTKLPDAVFIIDPTVEKVASLEAKKINIPTIALVDTNADPTEITYPIPGNDDAIKSVKYLCAVFQEAILEAKKKPSEKKEKND